MRNLYNTSFEVSLRVLLFLTLYTEPINIDRLTYLDYISVYAKDFGLTETNLNGENRYKHGELSAKRRSINNALKRLVLDRLIKATTSNSGILYVIEDLGKEYAKLLDSDYGTEYLIAVKSVLLKFGDLSDKELFRKINDHAINELGE